MFLVPAVIVYRHHQHADSCGVAATEACASCRSSPPAVVRLCSRPRPRAIHWPHRRGCYHRPSLPQPRIHPGIPGELGRLLVPSQAPEEPAIRQVPPAAQNSQGRMPCILPILPIGADESFDSFDRRGGGGFCGGGGQGLIMMGCIPKMYIPSPSPCKEERKNWFFHLHKASCFR
jgi:hypothetical protein